MSVISRQNRFNHLMIERHLRDPDAQLAFGVRLAACLPATCVIYLDGDLGTGKTTLTRGILAGLGHRGSVRSPTYTLIEPYQVADGAFYHLDLYRLSDPEELEYLGLRDLLDSPARWVIEWPDRGAGLLPPPDLRLQIDYLTDGRRLRLDGCTTTGRTILDGLAEILH